MRQTSLGTCMSFRPLMPLTGDTARSSPSSAGGMVRPVATTDTDEWLFSKVPTAHLPACQTLRERHDST